MSYDAEGWFYGVIYPSDLMQNLKILILRKDEDQKLLIFKFLNFWVMVIMEMLCRDWMCCYLRNDMDFTKIYSMKNMVEYQ